MAQGPASSAVEAGDNSAANLPSTDLAGNVRILDGNKDCVSTVDLAVYELVRSANVSFSSNTPGFSSQPIGTSSSPQSVTLSNTGTTCFQFSSTAVSGDFSQTNTCSSAGLRRRASTLTVSTTGRTPRGSFNLLIMGTSGSDVHSATVLFTVR